MFASEWYENSKLEWSPRTREDYYWTLRLHLLPFFAQQKLSAITPELVDRYRAQKLKDGKLSPNSINKTLTRLSQIMARAVEYGHIDRNPAAGKQRRCKPQQPGRASIGAAQVDALLEVTKGCSRALLATAILGGGLRVSEVTGLRWRDVNLATGTLQVAKAKTDAGVRVVQLDPWLREELAAWKMSSRFTDPDHYVFPGRHRSKVGGTVWDGHKRRDRNAVTRRILYPAITRANALLAERKLGLIPEAVTFHSLRRTYASLAAEAGVDPAWVAAQIGRKSARFTLDVYTDVGNRKDDPAERIGALVRGDSMGASTQKNDPEPKRTPEADPSESALESVNSVLSGG